MRKIIGITGSQGSGKDSIGDILVKHYGFLKMSFAAHLKDVASLLFFMDRKMLAGETPEDRKIREEPDKFWSEKLGYDFTPRHALQFLGTDLLRNQFSQNIWIDCLERKILETDKDVVITDVRFPNEIDMIRNSGGTIWRIEKPVLPEWFRKVEAWNIDSPTVEYNMAGFVPEIKDIHESEWKWIGLDKPEHIFKTMPTLEELEKEVLAYTEENW